MQLTVEQISTINETLVLNGLVYDDVKMELLDHIASEIEQAMDDKNQLKMLYKQRSQIGKGNYTSTSLD
jgi:hypothetical protein